MANTKSGLITNFEADPQTRVSANVMGGRKRVAVGKVEVEAADNDGHIYPLVAVHSSWCIHKITKYNDAIAGGTDYNFGLYSTDIVDVDENCYGDAVSLASADTAGTNVAFENRNIDNIGQQVWQDAGLTEDPNVWYYLCATGVTVGTVAGGIACEVEFTAND